MNSLAAAVLDALRDDPSALACLRELVGIEPAPTTEAHWFTVRSLATELGVSEKVVRNAIARGELQAVKRGARWYIDRGAVERWLGTAAERAGGRSAEEGVRGVRSAGGMSIHRKGNKWAVRCREGERNRSRSFDRKADAQRFDAEVTRRRQLGSLVSLTAGRETLDEFVTKTWEPTHVPTLSANTRRDYAYLYDAHIGPHLGSIPLRDLKPERIARWQADRLREGAGRVAIRKALDLLSSILRRAVELERIDDNPVRRVPKARRSRRCGEDRASATQR